MTTSIDNKKGRPQAASIAVLLSSFFHPRFYHREYHHWSNIPLEYDYAISVWVVDIPATKWQRCPLSWLGEPWPIHLCRSRKKLDNSQTWIRVCGCQLGLSLWEHSCSNQLVNSVHEGLEEELNCIHPRSSLQNRSIINAVFDIGLTFPRSFLLFKTPTALELCLCRLL